MMLCCAGLLFIVVAITSPVRGEDSASYMRDELQNIDTATYPWGTMKELENSKVALDIDSCKSKVEGKGNYVFALIKYAKWMKKVDEEVKDEIVRGLRKTFTPNGCSCNEVLDLFDFAYNKEPHLLTHLPGVYNLVCGDGYEKNAEKQKDLMDFLASRKVSTETIGILLDVSQELLRQYIVKLSLTDQEWGLESVVKQLEEEKKSSQEKIDAIIKTVGLAKSDGEGLEKEHKRAFLLNIVGTRFFAKSGMMNIIIKFGLKPDALDKLKLTNDLDTVIPIIKILILTELFENTQAKKMLSTEQERFFKIVNNLSVMFSVDSTVAQLPTKEVLSTFVNSVFNSATEKQGWSSELTEQTVQAFCKQSLKMMSGSPDQSNDQGAEKSKDLTSPFIKSIQEAFNGFDKTGFETYMESNKGNMLNELNAPLMFTEFPDISSHFKYPLECV